MPRFRKNPVEIEAEPVRTILEAAKQDWNTLPGWVREAYEKGVIVALTQEGLTVKTLEGDHLARRDDMLLRGVKGEIYPCKPDIFAETYTELTDG